MPGNPVRVERSKQFLNRYHRGQAQVWCYQRAIEGYSVREIAELATAHFERSISKSTVGRWLSAEYKERIEPVSEQRQQMELDKLDREERICNQLLEQFHYVVQGGKIIYGPEVTNEDGSVEALPLEDHTAKLAIIDRLVKIQERRHRLKGMDAPTQFSSNMTVNYTIDGVDPETLR